MANRQAIVPSYNNIPIYINEKPTREAIVASSIYINENTVSTPSGGGGGGSTQITSPTSMLMGV